MKESLLLLRIEEQLQRSACAKKKENRFKLHWENKAKAKLHLGQEYEKAFVFGRAREWSRNRDKRLFSYLEKLLELRRGQDVILDVGCGPLARAEVQFGLMGFKIIGLDISRTIVSQARKYAMEYGIVENTDFVVGDGEFLPFRSCTFDAIICIGTISHLPSVSSAKKAIKEMARIISQNGIIYVHWLQNLYSIFGIQELLFLKIVDLIGFKRAQYLLFRGLGEIQKLFDEARLSIKEIQYRSTIGLPTKIPELLPLFLRKIIFKTLNILDKHHIFHKFSSTFNVISKKKMHTL